MLLSDITESMINDYDYCDDYGPFHWCVFRHFFGPLCKSHKLFRILQRKPDRYYFVDTESIEKFKNIVKECFDDIDEYYKNVNEIKKELRYSTIHEDYTTNPMIKFKMYYIISKYTGNDSWDNFLCDKDTNKNSKFCLFCKKCVNCNHCIQCNTCKKCEMCSLCNHCDKCKYNLKCNYCKNCSKCIHCDYCDSSNDCEKCHHLEICNDCKNIDSVMLVGNIESNDKIMKYYDYVFNPLSGHDYD